MDLITRRAFLRAVLGAVALAGCGLAAPVSGDAGTDAGQTLQSTFFAFNTACVIGGSLSRDTLDGAVRQCMDFERLFSRTIGTSDVSRINAAGGRPVEVDAATAELVDAAQSYRAASGGTFDITIGAVSELWDFVRGVVPAPQAVAAALPHVGTEVVVDVGARIVRLADPEARIDLGGIAKGYVADATLASLAAAGVESAYVNLGGNVAVLGTKPDGSPWSVGVRDPMADEGSSAQATVATIAVEGGSVVTSGLYERSFERDGRRWWHILDPRSGYPVETRVVSATICSERSIDGDGYTKPLFFLDADGALEFVAERPGLQALLVLDDGTMVSSPGSGFEPSGARDDTAA